MNIFGWKIPFLRAPAGNGDIVKRGTNGPPPNVEPGILPDDGIIHPQDLALIAAVLLCSLVNVRAAIAGGGNVNFVFVDEYGTRETLLDDAKARVAEVPAYAEIVACLIENGALTAADLAHVAAVISQSLAAPPLAEGPGQVLEDAAQTATYTHESAVREYRTLVEGKFNKAAVEAFRRHWNVVSVVADRNNQFVLSDRIDSAKPPLWVLRNATTTEGRKIVYVAVPGPEVYNLKLAGDEPHLEAAVKAAFQLTRASKAGIIMIESALAEPVEPSGHYAIVKKGTLER